MHLLFFKRLLAIFDHKVVSNKPEEDLKTEIRKAVLGKQITSSHNEKNLS